MQFLFFFPKSNKRVGPIAISPVSIVKNALKDDVPIPIGRLL